MKVLQYIISLFLLALFSCSTSSKELSSEAQVTETPQETIIISSLEITDSAKYRGYDVASLSNGDYYLIGGKYSCAPTDNSEGRSHLPERAYIARVKADMNILWEVDTLLGVLTNLHTGIVEPNDNLIVIGNSLENDNYSKIIISISPKGDINWSQKIPVYGRNIKTHLCSISTNVYRMVFSYDIEYDTHLQVWHIDTKAKNVALFKDIQTESQSTPAGIYPQKDNGFAIISNEYISGEKGNIFITGYNAEGDSIWRKKIGGKFEDEIYHTNHSTTTNNLLLSGFQSCEDYDSEREAIVYRISGEAKLIDSLIIPQTTFALGSTEGSSMNDFITVVFDENHHYFLQYYSNDSLTYSEQLPLRFFSSIRKLNDNKTAILVGTGIEDNDKSKEYLQMYTIPVNIQ